MKIKLLFLLLITQFAFSQQRTCGVKEYMTKMLSNPEAKKQYLESQEKFEIEYKKALAQELQNQKKGAKNIAATIKVPVAVHFPDVPTNEDESLKACLRDLAQSQINTLNADYNAANTDISNWAGGASAFYPGVTVGSLDIEFVLATLSHPVETGLTEGSVAVTFGTDFLSNTDSDGTWARYMNLVCRDIPQGYLGYSPLGGSPASGQTVVILNTAFGKGAGCSGYEPDAPYNLGRTLTHELGHFFNLDHIFKDSGDCSGPDQDDVADTPEQGEETYGCADDGSIAGCIVGESTLTMNYMDYSDDACMYMFTSGQTARMSAYYAVIQNQFETNVLGTEEVMKNQFSIYPNPSKGSFTVQFSDLVNNYSVQVFDQAGRVVFENKSTNNNSLRETFNLNTTSAGVYFVTIKADNNITTKKIIVE